VAAEDGEGEEGEVHPYDPSASVSASSVGKPGSLAGGSAVLEGRLMTRAREAAKGADWHKKNNVAFGSRVRNDGRHSWQRRGSMRTAGAMVRQAMGVISTLKGVPKVEEQTGHRRSFDLHAARLHERPLEMQLVLTADEFEHYASLRSQRGLPAPEILA